MSHLHLVVALAAAVSLTACARRAPSDTTPSTGTEEGTVSTPAEPREEEVTFEAAGMTVYGTLSLPGGVPQRRPAVLLIAGSGPTDRDWNSPGLPGRNGSAALLAKALRDRGIVVLRYDKRGTGQTGVPKGVTWADYLAEQRAALELLRSRAEVDPKALYVAGHSEGGAHALKLAAAEGEGIAGLVLLSTAGRPLKVLVVEQVANQLRAALPPADAVKEINAFESAVNAISAGEAVDPQKATAIPGIQALLRSLQQPDAQAFIRELLAFDPVEALKALPHRTLVLSGEKDIQVSSERDVKPLAAARPEGTTLVLVADADHVLKAEERPFAQLNAGVGLRYNAQDRVLADGVVDAIATFISQATEAQR